jgi:hypothetical protein
MNTTTLTIESVHGIKQTFVLGAAERIARGEAKKDMTGHLAPKPETVPPPIGTQSKS